MSEIAHPDLLLDAALDAPVVRSRGRVKGSKNLTLRTRDRIQVATDILNSGSTPLGILWDMITGVRKYNERTAQLCIAVMPYVHPRLTAVELHGAAQQTHEQALEALDRTHRLNPVNEVSAA